jgi:hypothetical protein
MNDERDRDDVLVAELRGIVEQLDPVPPQVTAAAKAALGWRRLDAELAELLTDSSLETGELALARGSAAPLRSASFGASQLTIDIEIHVEGASRIVLGQLSPPSTATVKAQRADQAIVASTRADSLGRFRVELPQGGPVRLVITSAGAGPPTTETSWISL